VQHDQGGILTLTGDRAAAEERAEQVILRHCNGPFRIVSQRAVAVGAQAAEGRRPRVITEHRLTYKCAQAATPRPIR
jgi:hypothetical protein